MSVGIALLAFLFFVLRLQDTHITPVQRRVAAPAVPKTGVARDAELSVTVVLRDSDAKNDVPDSGIPQNAKPIPEAQVRAFWQQGREYFSTLLPKGAHLSFGDGFGVLGNTGVRNVVFGVTVPQNHSHRQLRISRNAGFWHCGCRNPALDRCDVR